MSYCDRWGWEVEHPRKHYSRTREYQLLGKKRLQNCHRKHKRGSLSATTDVWLPFMDNRSRTHRFFKFLHIA